MHSGGRRFDPCQLHSIRFLFFDNLEIGKIESPSPVIQCSQVIFKINNTLVKATKGVRGMPRHMETMKDAISCDKPRVGANNL